MNVIKQFIEANRQTGTTTALIRAVRETKGYLIVSDTNRKNMLIKKDPELKDHIFTCWDIHQGSWQGRKMGTIFFDTDAIWTMMERPVKETGIEKQPQFVYQSNNTDYFHPTNVVFCCDTTPDGYDIIDTNTIKHLRDAVSNIEQKLDGYGNQNTKNSKQLNIKLTDEDLKELDSINADFYEGEASNSMLGRIILRKGFQLFRKLKEIF